MARKKRPPDEDSSGSWLQTYGDLMSLLLCFFILIVSFSNTEIVKLRKAFTSLHGALGVMPQHAIIPPANQKPMPDLNDYQRMIIMKTLQGLTKFLYENDIYEEVGIELTSKGIRLRISSPLLFELGGADLKSEIRPVLSKLAELTKSWPSQIRIEGHTDDLPIHTSQYPSNWELSSDRAMRVLKYFEDQGSDPSKLAAVGYAEHHPLVPNDSAENRAKNRRVEIFIEHDDGGGMGGEGESINLGSSASALDWTSKFRSSFAREGEKDHVNEVSSESP